LRFIATACLMVATAALPAAAHAQSADTRNRALIVLDASKSMNEDAGNGGTRLDAAKQAVGTLLDRLPAGAPLGLRVYGSKVAETSRAEGCRDTELAVPVGPLDKEAMRSRVQALTGKGRTPIGNSLLAVPDDLGPSEGRRTVILVSDGGDNCAPPNPCDAAREVSKQGVDLSISVVGLQVNERVRRQLECIAKAGGGTYVDVQDADELADELAAALSRAFRSYDPAGTEVEGGPAAEQAASIKTGLFQDAIAPGETRWYAVDVPEGRRLLASVSAIPAQTDEGQSALRTELLDPQGQRLEGDSEVLFGRTAGANGRVRTQSLSMADFAGAEGLPAGRYTFQVQVEDGLSADAVPVELGIQLLAPGETPGLTRAAGELGAVATPTATPEQTPVAPPATVEADDGLNPLVIVLAAIGGVAVGLAAALVLTRRRTA
jgi:Ca-activated chloride channel family protein